EENRAIGRCEALESLRKFGWSRDHVGIEPKQLELRQLLLELGFKPLGAGAEARELSRTAFRAKLRSRLTKTAMVTVEESVTVKRERDVAARAPARRSARPTVDRGRDASPVEEEDRLAAAVGDRAEF